MIAPALLIAVKQIAWTPVAERYLYLPTAFFCIGLATQASDSRPEIHKLLYGLLLVLISFFAYISFERTLLWKDKVAFLKMPSKNLPALVRCIMSWGCWSCNAARWKRLSSTL